MTTEEGNCGASQQNMPVKGDTLSTANNWVEADGQDSDHYNEIDANDQVGNVDTLVDGADIENVYAIYHQVFTFAPGE